MCTVINLPKCRHANIFRVFTLISIGGYNGGLLGFASSRNLECIDTWH